MSKKENLKRILLCVFLFAFTVVSIGLNPVTKHVEATDSVSVEKIIDTCKLAYIQNNLVDTISEKDNIQLKLLEEVKRYIKGKASTSEPIIAEHIVKTGLAHNLDICFIMSQTEIETCYGTAGIGRHNHGRSIFGVYRRTYNSYPAAIDDWVNLLHKSYLVKGRTENDLLRNYVTGSGARYATNPTYEVELRSAYNRIKGRTKIYELQKQYSELL